MATKVSRLVNYATKYELILTDDQDSTFLIAYTLRKGKTDLIKAIRNRGIDILEVTQLGEDAQFTFTSPQSATLGSWVVKFTGRTQKDAICTHSERPYIGTIAENRRTLTRLADAAVASYRA